MLLRVAVLLVILACVQAQTTKKESPSILDAILCIVNARPTECAREQAGRLLNSWSDIIEAKKLSLIAEADLELQKHAESRGMKDETSKQQEKPSILLKAIESGLESMSEVISDGVDEYVDDDDDSVEEEVKTTNTLEGSSKTTAGQLGKHGIKIKIKKHGTGRGGGGGFGGGDKKGGFGGGKNKKKRQQLMKLVLIGATIKSKIELFLRVLSFHLQVKFFTIAAIGLIINIVRLWVDAKKGHQPQKVIYYEHAQHQHHYDEHDDWSGGGSGSPSYWKRASTGHSDGPEYYEARSAHDMAYSGQKH